MKRPLHGTHLLWLLFVVLTLPQWSAAQTNSQPPSVGVPSLTNDLPVLMQVTNAPFQLFFRAYSDGGHNFAINLLTRSRSYLVSELGMEVGGRYSGMGYIVKKFELKRIPATDGYFEVKDVSELTLQHEGEEPIVLVLGEAKTVSEPVARVVCPGGTQEQEVRRDQSFRCGDTRYIVADIKPNEMMIRDVKSGEKKTILLSAPKQ